MQIILENVGKKYKSEWIFKKINLTLNANKFYGLVGPNGSGKSTLLRVLSGHLTPSVGTIKFSDHQKDIKSEHLYKYISYAAPYIELIEEFSLEEHFDFHRNFKPIIDNMSFKEWFQLLDLKTDVTKPIQYYSSGMKQKLKLGLTICSDSNLLLLDEPSTNLDTNATSWFQNLLKRFSKDRIVIIASNVQADLSECKEIISINDFKEF